MALPTVGAVFGVFPIFFFVKKNVGPLFFFLCQKMFRSECLGLVKHIFFFKL